MHSEKCAVWCALWVEYKAGNAVTVNGVGCRKMLIEFFQWNQQFGLVSTGWSHAAHETLTLLQTTFPSPVSQRGDIDRPPKS